MDLKVHPIRGEGRWYYSLDGERSERTYPTAGDAERAGMIASRVAQKKNKRWQWILIWIAIGAPVAYFLVYLIGLLFGG